MRKASRCICESVERCRQQSKVSCLGFQGTKCLLVPEDPWDASQTGFLEEEASGWPSGPRVLGRMSCQEAQQGEPASVKAARLLWFQILPAGSSFHPGGAPSSSFWARRGSETGRLQDAGLWGVGPLGRQFPKAVLGSPRCVTQVAEISELKTILFSGYRGIYCPLPMPFALISPVVSSQGSAPWAKAIVCTVPCFPQSSLGVGRVRWGKVKGPR